MNVAVIDADLIGRRHHRFPNLVCMKLSAFHKERGDTVTFKLDYDNLNDFDKVYVAKVFSDTEVPQVVFRARNVVYGGTGFFYDSAPPLPEEVEHHMPDYHLYDEWASDKPARETKFYREYSIGFLTRGCFRHCTFCVNRRSNAVRLHSPLSEFYDPARKKIALLDDNFLGCSDWHRLLMELQATGKRFTFRQGLDIRLLDDEKAPVLFASKYDKDFYFAFDDIRDELIIEKKLKLIRRHTNKQCRFYLLCGFDRRGIYDENFWLSDIKDLFDRIVLLKQYDMLGYVMRYKRVAESPFCGLYTTIAAWCNQPHLFRKKTLRDYALLPKRDTDLRRLNQFQAEHYDLSFYFDLK